MDYTFYNQNYCSHQIIFKEYYKQVEQFDEMRKKEEKARAVRQQIIADMHNSNDNKYNNNSNNRHNNRTNMKQPSSAVSATNKNKFVSLSVIL